MTLPIEDYAFVGDCESGALVSRDGSIDWLCWPRFDSPACFAALLGDRENGHWTLAPASRPQSRTRRYRDDTLILETDYDCSSGRVRVIDFMPPCNGRSDLIRLVVGLGGHVDMCSELRIRFDYGEVTPWVTRIEDDTVRAIAGPDMVVLRTSAPMHGVGRETVSTFTVRKGEQVPFLLSYHASHESIPKRIDVDAQLAGTESFWLTWAQRCMDFGPYTSIIRRSLLTLKALTYAPTGGIVAAVTTSLPEYLGGERNWDYRYCWLRDASFCLDALLDVGYMDEALAFRDWLTRAAANSIDRLQVMYGLRGERRLPEVELTHLRGYHDSQPVLIGNDASHQFQLDIYGEVADALSNAVIKGAPPSPLTYRLAIELMSVLEKRWTEPDAGIWEVRGPPQHFTYSKVMAWVMFDRVIRAAAYNPGRAIPIERWKTIRDTIHEEVCAKAWNPDVGAFTQAYGSPYLDASVLRMALVGFLEPSDPRIVATVDAIARRLRTGCFVRRYESALVDDGLKPGEGSFLACSFWLADNYILQGRVDEGRALFDELITLCNDVGLLSEEYDPVAKRFLGNYPQAFSHVALVGTGIRLHRALLDLK